MVMSQQITPGMVLSIGGKLYRVESSLKVTVAKGTPFIKTELRDIASSSQNAVIEKNFKLNQEVPDVTLTERRLEYLYPEGKGHLFLDIGNLEQVLVPAAVIGNKTNYLKEGVEIRAAFYGETIFAVELPQFLELMVAKIETRGKGNDQHVAVLETGAEIEVLPFIQVGDIIKIDPSTNEYIQRV